MHNLSVITKLISLLKISNHGPSDAMYNPPATQTSLKRRQVDYVSTRFHLSRSQGHILILKVQRYIQWHLSKLEDSSEFQRYTSASSDIQELPQRMSRSIQDVIKAKDQDFKIKSKDIKLKIKIQDHKHTEGSSKEFTRPQGSKIQDVTRSEAIPKFLIKMPPRRNRDINDIYEQELEQHIIARMDEQFDQFIDQFGDYSSFNEWEDYGMASDNYERVTIFNDDYEEVPLFNDDQFEEESMPVFNTDIKDVIEEEEGFVGKGGFGEEEENTEDLVVVANALCSSMIQTTLSVDFSKTIDSNPHELIWNGKMMVLADDDYKEFPLFDDDQYEDVIEEEEGFVDNYPNFQEDENNVSFSGVVLGVKVESTPVYDTDIEDVIEEEEGFIGK
ncbi:hypothetical protein Tco_0540279 [Tanacetum coccineum]